MEITNLKQFTKVLNQQSITNVGYVRVLFSAPVPFFLSISIMMVHKLLMFVDDSTLSSKHKNQKSLETLKINLMAQ